MADFNDIRKELNDSRNARAKTSRDLFLARERLRKTDAELKQLDRIYDPGNPIHASRKKMLTAQFSEEKERVKNLQGAFNEATINEKKIYGSFEAFTDPRELISGFSDSYPILLFPVRIETRFRKVVQNREQANELWIRVFPDDCVINTFEPVPSFTELDDTAFYWSLLWQSCGDEAQERAAWRTLVSSHGSGRAKWLIKNFRPENETDKPVKDKPEDVALVITIHAWPPDREQPLILDYWARIWKADGDTARMRDAYDKLVENVGITRAQEINKTLVPANIDARPGGSGTTEEVNVKAVFLKLPDRSTIDCKEDSWSQAPHVDNMPERFVVTGYWGGAKDFEVIGRQVPSPLYTGPDPSLPRDKVLRKEKGKLRFDDGMLWMSDFDEAIRIGMGFKVPLTPQQAKRGFDKITVLGVRLSSDAAQGAGYLESLVTDHSNSRKGFEILPQGTATNNTDTEGSGWLSADDPDRSFDEMKKDTNFNITPVRNEKADGQLLAEYLGLDPGLFLHITGSGCTDQRDAWAMNTALWPATLGYLMESLMQPVFTDEIIENTREFFTSFVSGRGAVPAVRIGRQPYGILPAARFDTMRWFLKNQRPSVTHWMWFSSYLMQLYAVLSRIDQDWSSFLNKLSWVGKPGDASQPVDAHKLLLDIVGLNPVSVEFFRRYAESVESLHNRQLFYAFMIGGGSVFNPALYPAGGLALLQSFGYKGEETPEILNKIFVSNQDRMSPHLIDDRPVSEKEIIRSYMPGKKPEEGNYIRWLIDAVKISHDTLRKQQGFMDNRPPAALLYLMLHHALDLSYVEVSLQLHLKAEVLNTAQVRQAKIDPVFLHVQEQNSLTESKWKYLYKEDQKITGNSGMLIGEYIPQLFGNQEMPAAYMTRMLEALEHLKSLKTAQLERAFTEHIDCCSYRLDAWKNGFMHAQLQAMRYPQPGEDDVIIPNRGVYLGAFGYLENVRSENKLITPAEIKPELRPYFEGEGLPALVKDDKNEGYILAPSLNQAVTAAILRNGYTSNATPDQPDILKVNISSERVRKALSVIEGMRGGQSLGALLGYQLERGLHENYPGVELDYYIYQLRKAFPLRGNRLKSTREEGVEAEVIDARNVVDGLSLINHIQKTGITSYPFGKALEAVENSEQQAAINKEVNKIMDLNDAIADVAIAESVHQTVMGNFDRAGATLDTYSKGHFPPIPDVIQTPRSGMNITHRVGLQFEAGVNALVSPLPGMSMTPRAMAEPAVNKWLAGILPPPSVVACEVEYYDLAGRQFVALPQPVTQTNLGMQPIDMLYLAGTQGTQAMSTLDDRITKYVLSHYALRPDAEIRINYTKRFADKNRITFFELTPLLDSLRAVVLHSRPLQANDVARPGEVKLRQKPVVRIDENRVKLARTQGVEWLEDLLDLLTPLGVLLEDTTANREALISNIDVTIDELTDAMLPLNDFIPELTGIGFAYGWKSDTFKALITLIRKLVDRWEARLVAFDKYLDEYNNPISPLTREQQEKLLQGAERQVTTLPQYPLPANLGDFIISLEAQRTLFNARLMTFRDSLILNTDSLSALLNDIRPKLDYAAFDLEETDISGIENAILLFLEDLHHNFLKTHTELSARFTAADSLLSGSVNPGDDSKKTEQIQKAAKKLFGDDFLLVPEFMVSGDQADEWQNVFNDETQLLAFSAPSPTSFPVDDWMHGVARVREKMRHLENIVFLTEAFNTAGLPLHPLQLPYQPGDSWVAVGFPAGYEIDNDKVLYTASYSETFNKNIPQCGLLVDEWTELIPAMKETAGVAFHYDKPNSEPPQVMLLALPSDFRGQWRWDDLAGTLLDTFEQAKKRAIEPDHIDSTSYAWFLPAVISSVMGHRIAPSLNLALTEIELFKFLDLPDND